jgi:hypothetical protein
MKKKLSLLLLGLVSAISFATLTSCETTPKPYDDNFSTLPQNRPQSWEGSAAMGAFVPQSM